MAENLRGEMCSDSTKVRYPQLNLDWILNATNDETNEVF